MDTLSDEALVGSAQTGDQSAFAELVARHKHRVFSLASRFTQDPHQLEDLAQETFIRVWQRLDQFRAEAPFEHWLARIAVNACYDFLRRQRRTAPTVTLDGIELPVVQEGKESAEMAREILEPAMARLKAEDRLVLTLLELEERSIREVAKLTGWSEANVKVRAFRARQTLKKILTPP